MSFLTQREELFVQFRKKKEERTLLIGPYIYMYVWARTHLQDLKNQNMPSAFDSVPLAAYRIIDLVLLYKNKNKNWFGAYANSWRLRVSLAFTSSILQISSSSQKFKKPNVSLSLLMFTSNINQILPRLNTPSEELFKINRNVRRIISYKISRHVYIYNV